MPLEPIQFKRGDSFYFQCELEPATNSPVTFEGWTITSSVQTSDGVRYPATVTVAGDFLSFTTDIPETEGWALGPGEWDFKLIVDGRIKHTQTIPLSIVKQITL